MAEEAPKMGLHPEDLGIQGMLCAGALRDDP